MPEAAETRELVSNRRLQPILIFFTILGIIGFLTTLVYGITVTSVGPCLIWALACLTGGIAIGFLFAIPKILQGTQGANEDRETLDYKLHVNTNLTEISDWLTKIIVGLSLVNLTKLPPYLTSMAVSLSNGIHDKEKSAAVTVAYGVIIFYSVLGFLFGYLFTRLFLSKALSIADQDSIQQIKGQFEIQNASTESKIAFLTDSSLQASTASKAGTESTGEALTHLRNLADKYMAINIVSWAERTQAKDAMANEMAIYALKHGIDSNTLFEYIRKDSSLHEGLVLALANLININPQKDDFNKLVEVGENLTRLHVRFRVLLVIVSLKKKGYIDDQSKRQAIDLVKKYKVQADTPLKRQIDHTLSFLNEAN